MAEEKSFNATKDLDAKEQKYFTFFNTRIKELQDTRKNVYGVDIEKIWGEADKAYVPHRLGNIGKKVIATDEERGWRGALVRLGQTNWQSDISQANPFIKIQVAQAILIDQNPSGVFTPASKKYQATNELMRQLYQRSWEFAKSKQQLKLFVHNLGKYGWAAGRTYPLHLKNKVRTIKRFDPENPDNTEYDEKEVTEFNDVFRENLDVWNVWIDDMAKPNNQFTLRDWSWRKVYPMDIAEQEFGKYKLWKKVQAGGTTTEKIESKQTEDKQFQEKDLVEIYFYENKMKDLFMVIANGVPIVIEPLPISDQKGNKKLSLWQAYWNLRHAETPYGIGIYEAIRYDQALLDRIRNMTIDQLTLSIYKMFFHTGTAALTDTGDIVITPGVGKQLLDPKSINWLDIPGPGKDAYLGLDMAKRDIDDASGITPSLEGEVTGKTAFEIAQAKESALKRLKSPLDNILDALDSEAYLTIALIQLLYSIPETFAIADPNLAEAYLQEIDGDPALYSRDENDVFTANVFREFPLNLDEDDQGNYIETEETKFFRVKPSGLSWEGIINVKSQSILSPSKQIDKALDLEMYNLLIPLLVQPPEIYDKVAKNIVKLYDKDPRDILPDLWLMSQEQRAALLQQQAPLFVNPEQEAQQQPPGQAQKAVGSTQLPSNQQSLAGKIMGRLSAPFRST